MTNMQSILTASLCYLSTLAITGCEGGSYAMDNRKRRLSLPLLQKNSLEAPEYKRKEQEEEAGPTQIFDFLFLGSKEDALNTDLLKRYDIRYVINVSEEYLRPEVVSDDTRHFMHIPVGDSFCADLLSHFEQVFQFIEEARRDGGKVLVHCLAGISRSPALVISYVMRYKSMSFEEAHRFVKQRRSTIALNFNFVGQLMNWESGNELSGTPSSEGTETATSSFSSSASSGT